MRKEQKDIDGLGPIGIVREALKLLFTHARFSMLIQLTLILPVATLMVIQEYVIYRTFPLQNRPPAGTSPVPHLPSNLGVSFNANASGPQQAVSMLALVLISLGAATILGAAKSLSSSAILYAVGLYYTGQSISFRDVIRVTIPNLWLRLTVTNIYKTLILYSILTVQNVGSLLLIQNHSALPVMLLGVTALSVIGMISMGCLVLIFTIAVVVSVLEKDYGWAAVRRTPKLLQERVTVAIFFQLLWLLPTVITLGLSHAFRNLAINGDFSPSSLTALMFTTIVNICWISFFWHMDTLCAGVQYVSFKAHHNEDLAGHIYETQIKKGGYYRVGGGSDDAKVVGKQTATIV